MQLLPSVFRILLGLVFFIFGLNGFLGFIPMPEHNEAGGAFLGALAATGYMFPVIKGTEVVSGLMLLANRFVPLALVLLAPVIINIVAFHTLLEPGNFGMVGLILVAELFLAWSYRHAYGVVLVAKHRPQPLLNEARAGSPSAAAT